MQFKVVVEKSECGAHDVYVNIQFATHLGDILVAILVKKELQGI
jgi:hypothetical protein